MRSSGESVQSENHHMQHAMKVWFHGGYNEVILFQFWSVNSYTGKSAKLHFLKNVL